VSTFLEDAGQIGPRQLERGRQREYEAPEQREPRGDASNTTSIPANATLPRRIVARAVTPHADKRLV